MLNCVIKEPFFLNGHPNVGHHFLNLVVDVLGFIWYALDPSYWLRLLRHRSWNSAFHSGGMCGVWVSWERNLSVDGFSLGNSMWREIFLCVGVLTRRGRVNLDGWRAVKMWGDWVLGLGIVMGRMAIHNKILSVIFSFDNRGELQ